MELGGASRNSTGGLSPFRPLSSLQDIHVATLEESGVLGFPSRRGLTPRGSLECNPEIPAFTGTTQRDGMGRGGRVQDGEHMYTCGGFILMFVALHSPQAEGFQKACEET